MRISSQDLAKARALFEQLTAAAESRDADDGPMGSEADYLEAREALDRLLDEWELATLHDEVQAAVRQGFRQLGRLP